MRNSFSPTSAFAVALTLALSQVGFAATAIPPAGAGVDAFRDCLIETTEAQIPQLRGRISHLFTDAASGKIDGAKASLLVLVKGVRGGYLRYSISLELNDGGKWQLVASTGSLPGLVSAENLKPEAHVYKFGSPAAVGSAVDIARCLPSVTY